MRVWPSQMILKTFIDQDLLFLHENYYRYHIIILINACSKDTVMKTLYSVIIIIDYIHIDEENINTKDERSLKVKCKPQFHVIKSVEN